MRGHVLWQLARPLTVAERRRWLVLAVACCVLTAVVLMGIAMGRAQASPEGTTFMRGPSDAQPLSPLLQDRGLRAGVVAAAVLACLPPLVLLLQALRVGSSARERTLAALRVAGASHAHLRRIAGAEGASAGFAGAIFGAVAYLLLGVAARHSPTIYLHLLPPLDVHDLWLTALVVAAVTGLAAWSARRSAADVMVAPQRVRTHIVRPLPRSRAVAALVLVALSLALTAVALSGYGVHVISTGALIAVIALVVGALLLGAPYLVRGVVRRAARRGDPMALLASGRVVADPRGPGRVGAVAAVCAAAIAGGIPYAVDVAAERWGQDYSDIGFFVSGAGLVVVLALGALLICVVSLVVGASEQIRDGARSTAVLTAFGVDEAALQRALLRQLRATTVPSAVVGALCAALFMSASSRTLLGHIGVVVGIAVAVLAVRGAARLAALLVRQQVVEATSADNLRTA